MLFIAYTGILAEIYPKSSFVDSFIFYIYKKWSEKKFLENSYVFDLWCAGPLGGYFDISTKFIKCEPETLDIIFVFSIKVREKTRILLLIYTIVSLNFFHIIKTIYMYSKISFLSFHFLMTQML